MDAEWPITRLGVDDYDAICTLWQASGLPIRPGGRDSREQFERQLAGGTQFVLGVHSGEHLIGVIVATHDGRKGWLNRLAVHPDFRRQGIGQHLIAAAEQQLYQQGLQIIAALIEGGNTASLALFERAGYSDFEDIHYVSKRQSPEV
ncbi:MAG: GNAT family N-acetyltransferase [Chloroflexi bacterium]|nr:GNAT family N-acetyltransferase [Chloroflexota bacterium]